MAIIPIVIACASAASFGLGFGARGLVDKKIKKRDSYYDIPNLNEKFAELGWEYLNANPNMPHMYPIYDFRKEVKK